jgi:hypothetical protein
MDYKKAKLIHYRYGKSIGQKPDKKTFTHNRVPYQFLKVLIVALNIYLTP